MIVVIIMIFNKKSPAKFNLAGLLYFIKPVCLLILL
jgi:hypothetical protein